MRLAAFTNIWKKEEIHGDKEGVRAVSGGILPGPVLWECEQTLPDHDRCRTQETHEPVDRGKPEAAGEVQRTQRCPRHAVKGVRLSHAQGRTPDRACPGAVGVRLPSDE